jgi:hypothetical protein
MYSFNLLKFYCVPKKQDITPTLKEFMILLGRQVRKRAVKML